MPLETIGIPRVKLLTHPEFGRMVALECLCGDPLPYPDVNGAPNPITCAACGQRFGAVAPTTLSRQVWIEK